MTILKCRIRKQANAIFGPYMPIVSTYPWLHGSNGKATFPGSIRSNWQDIMVHLPQTQNHGKCDINGLPPDVCTKWLWIHINHCRATQSPILGHRSMPKLGEYQLSTMSLSVRYTDILWFLLYSVTSGYTHDIGGCISYTPLIMMLSQCC